MAGNGAKEHLLSGLPGAPLLPGKKQPPKRRFRHCRSAPLTESIALRAHGIGRIPRPGSILGNLHPSFIHVAICLGVYVGLGTICFYLTLPQIKGKKTNGILDSVYFCIVTMTTVGYGDLVPNSVLTKLLACGFVFTGMALVGLILSKAADYLVEKQEMLLLKALHKLHIDDSGEVANEIQAHRAGHKWATVFIFLLILIIVGTVFLVQVEKLDLVDAFYCVCSTITTLGYGDQSFSTESGRVFAIFWILSSTICLAQFFLYLAELKTESRQQSLVKWVLARKMTNVDLEAADLDGDGVVGVAEFIIYKLKEMGKINQEDISLVMEEFEELDVDQSGTLSVSDLALAQSSQVQ